MPKYQPEYPIDVRYNQPVVVRFLDGLEERIAAEPIAPYCPDTFDLPAIFGALGEVVPA